VDCLNPRVAQAPCDNPLMQSLGYSTLAHEFFPALNWKWKWLPNKQIMTT